MEVSNRLVNEYEQTYPELLEINREIAVYFDNQINNQVEAVRQEYQSYDEINAELSDPAICSDIKKLTSRNYNSSTMKK